MNHVRPWLRILAASWLVCQMLTISVALTVLRARPGATRELCECPGSIEAQTCPMHHGRSAGHDGSNCAFRSGCPSGDEALLSVISATGLLPDVTFVTLDGGSTSVVTAAARAHGLSIVPDAPPPRS